MIKGLFVFSLLVSGIYSSAAETCSQWNIQIQAPGIRAEVKNKNGECLIQFYTFNEGASWSGPGYCTLDIDSIIQKTWKVAPQACATLIQGNYDLDFEGPIFTNSAKSEITAFD